MPMGYSFSGHAAATGVRARLVGGMFNLVDTSTSVLTVASITCDGVAMTPVPSSSAIAGSSTFDKTQLFYLLNPAAGTHTIAVTFGGAGSPPPPPLFVGLLPPPPHPASSKRGTIIR